MRSLLILFLYINFTTFVYSTNGKAKFYSLDSKDGLSNNDVQSVFKDSKGYLWFGTRLGLNRYDGYTFTVFKNEINNPESLNGNEIFSIVEDKSKQIWVLTENGLNKLNRDNETFKHYPLNIKANSTIKPKSELLYVDKSGKLWIGTNNGLIEFDVLKGEPVKKYLTQEPIISIIEDENNNLWLGTWNAGLIKFDLKKNIAYKFLHNPTDPTSLPGNIVFSIFQDSEKQIWIGTDTKGLCKYNTKENNFSTFKHPFVMGSVNDIKQVDKHTLWVCVGHSIAEINTQSKKVIKYVNNPLNPTSFTADIPRKMYKDNGDIIWILTSTGIIYSDANRDKFSSYYLNTNELTKKYYTNSFVFDQNNNAWISTFDNGLLFYNRNTGHIDNISFSEKNGYSNSINFITAIAPNEYWLSTSNGILIFNPQQRKVVSHIKHSSSNRNSPYHDNIYKTLKDKKGNIWIITQESIDLIRDGKYIHFTKNNLEGLNHYKVTDILEDKKGDIWVATYLGLNKFDFKTNKFTQQFKTTNDDKTIKNSYVLSIFLDSKGSIWVPTRNGLYVSDEKKEIFSRFIFPSNSDFYVCKLAEDKFNNIWLVSESDLLKFNRSTGTLKQYNQSDGIQVNKAGIFKDKNDEFYVGGIHTGFYRFNPENIQENLVVPPVYITDIKLFNKSVKVQEHSILDKHISLTNKITLSHNQSVLGFEFAALNFTLPEKNQYAYKLEGFDKEWNYVNSKQRFISYTNLEAGEYTLRVKGSNNDGVWNDKGVSLNIEVLPPFWQTKIAYFIYIIVLIGLLFVYRYISIWNYKKRMQVKLEKLQLQKTHEIDTLKLRFFTNISHEFRTPLTLIIGPLNKLMNDVKMGIYKRDELLDNFLFIQRNANKLILLINQLLDLQKTETGMMKLDYSHGDVISFLKSEFSDFKALATEKNLEQQFITDIERLEINFDIDKLSKISSNLLSNAFKYARTKVFLKVNCDTDNLHISIEDDGMGIASTELNRIFDNFYQAENSPQLKNKGSGIGLSLTRELVTLLNGTIEVKSEVGVYTTFIVSIPLINKDIFSRSNLLANSNQHNEQKVAKNEVVVEIINHGDLEKVKPMLLLVEDNTDLRKFISKTLSETYTIIEAENGKIGIESAFEFMPELIISDIMMPEVDGIELCNTLKNDVRTSHIPIILLTALGSAESKIKGIETGADDYITKPFDASILNAKIKNLIDTRKRLHLKFKHDVFVKPNDTSINVTDEKFLKRAIEFIEKNIENPELDIQYFIEAMNVSRSGLYTKIKALTGQSVSDFIKTIRLRKAAQLLITREFNITEVSFRVGFQNRTHFNNSFKKQFSLTPSEFIKQNTH